MKRRVQSKQVKPAKPRTSRHGSNQPLDAATSPGPIFVRFFARFRPDGEASDDLKDTVLAYGFFAGKSRVFPLALAPALEKFFDTALNPKADLPKDIHKTLARSLVEFVTNASFRLVELVKKHPEIMGEIARQQPNWPIVASVLPGWERVAREQLSELGFGRDLHDTQQIVIPLRKPSGADENYPARRWAKEALRCLNVTRILQRQLALKEQKAGTNLWQGDWRRVEEPSWATKTRDLPNFSKETLREWVKVIREMIREQVPDFHLRPEWQTQRNSCKARGKDSKGEVQNAILDDIASALKRLTLKETNQDLLKSGC